mmetsp:Transcript_7894/g.13653  ORF Transcript_7894/g.13653 Transcript_7894/m.13653 type:complete len:203 (-) Transcript_7894:401-1009(-)|eukprot:CAMPEP_0198209736 /NCGR_PEP_ID=MMETSP1445-20131203/17700_1 /TAXON_ID=36898 /ORGANISM="Pyramimonas sp., Strain CCMP2087" /LENGTH=202 /DNA_ID=CAMNT_0043883607 /DNA_START=301 /DNA_END=909 /DNA_ORIENTATION=-
MTKRKVREEPAETQPEEQPSNSEAPPAAKKVRPSKKKASEASDKKAPEAIGVSLKDKQPMGEAPVRTGFDFDEHQSDDEETRARKEENEAEKRERMKAILALLTPDQMDRYECYRRSALQRSSVKRLMQSLMSSGTVSLPMTIVLAGITKLFVGELVEGGKTVMEERSEMGPLRPVHVREAFRRITAEGKLPTRHKPALFKN